MNDFNRGLYRHEDFNTKQNPHKDCKSNIAQGAGSISPFESEGQDLDTEVHCDMDQQRRYESTTTYDNGLLLKPTMRARTMKVTD